jgi:ATP-dependent helicase YprA (DUF1998 family)
MTVSTPSLTIAQTISEIREALRDYIEATYHVGHPGLVEQRRLLLEQEGVLFRAPYIESTPRYVAGRTFSELDIPGPAKSLLTRLTHEDAVERPLLFDPPYTHQATALEATTRDGKSLVVTTGTGSGKTEAFMLPILAKLAQEAATSPDSFATPSLRALLLYPMNALVNDQLGRLRLLFGDPRVTTQFSAWAGRPARFARYTSRTLYPGVRTAKKDQVRLRSIERFYVALLQQAEDPEARQHDVAIELIANLRRRGKWPAKPDLQQWFGASGARWQNRAGEFVRAVLMPDDPELLTRAEVLANPPDILVTNYSMLEYTLMRPLERPIFDATRRWLSENPEQKLMLVVDEAHLYRGAAGAEVALLLRRLRSRLAVPAERLQVICTSASFDDPNYARDFAAQLVGKSRDEFQTVQGELLLRPGEANGSKEDAEALAAISLTDFYDSIDDMQRLAAVRPFLDYRGRQGIGGQVGPALYDALHDFPPMSQLVNLTMKRAAPLDELGDHIFPIGDASLAARALTVLVALGSAARHSEGEAGLLPCRIHAFFRGLPGLWACLDAGCPQSSAENLGSPVGALYSQPRASCTCGARVFELYTCRNCGTAYARAYTDDVESPSFLWNEPGGSFFSAAGEIPELFALDLLLEEPSGAVEPADVDVITGRLNPHVAGERMRRVYLPLKRSGDIVEGDDDDDSGSEANGEFKPCGVCAKTAGYGRSSVQDHQTKGDQPFQALVTRQLEVQPPGLQPYSDFAPLRGRKVLAFSDSRQTAARLAPNLQTYSMQDVLRPVVLRGWRALSETVLDPYLSLEDLYVAVLIGSRLLSVRLRPELKGTESMHALQEVTEALSNGALNNPMELAQLRMAGGEPPPQALLRGIVTTITDRYYGLPSLGLASLRERRNLEPRLAPLPAVPGIAETADARRALVRLWLSQWSSPTAGIWFQNMNPSWWQTRRGVRPHSGKFAVVDRWLPDINARKVFDKEWLPVLLEIFCEYLSPKKHRIRAATLALEVGGVWGYCQRCRTTQRPFPGSTKCVSCQSERVDTVDPDTDVVFAARKGYYRASSLRSLKDPPDRLMGIIAAEHTAQLNAAQSDEVFSKAEEHELLFQDADLGIPSPGAQPRTAIDVLSCTTTMEVGIDIGTLSGVALRNMPPSRASYQQRAGRAGRRGNAVATVVAFGSADSHDEHYFSEPDAMIRGRVDDPALTLDNDEIARRHITAFLFQRYHQARLPEIDPASQPQLFEVLGTVDGFLSETSPLNRQDFEVWLRENEAILVQDVRDWLPTELAAAERDHLLADIVRGTLDPVDRALAENVDAIAEQTDLTATEGDDVELTPTEAAAEEGEERVNRRRTVDNLLDRLLYKGVLPRYAFPTDVVSFHVFDRDRSTRFRPEFRYAPSQGLPIALSQFAPGKEVWIDGKLWRSGALYSPMQAERSQAWQQRLLYFECSVCHYARTESHAEADRGELRDCPACGSEGTFGTAKNWIRPPGFAHPVSLEEGTSLDDQPARSYATRAKLVAPGPSDPDNWRDVTPHIREHYRRTHLLVTNTGPRREGYTYCVRCGLIEPTAIPTATVVGPHPKPFPDDREPTCSGSASTRGLVLGTDFISDVLLVGLRVEAPLVLRPGFMATEVVLRTLAEGITIAATRRLEIEATELQAEYRPALNHGGHLGLEAEIYIYDTLAGGAGFARRVGDLGRSIFEDTVALLMNCPADCDRSCYRCLRSFRNRFEHDLLDRHLGASLLRYLLDGVEPSLHKRRLEHAADRLFEDLSRQGLSEVAIERNVIVEVAGIGSVEAPILVRSNARQYIVGIHGPLTPNHAADEQLREAMEYGSTVPVILIDEIVVSLNLPWASRQVIEAIR